MSDGEALKNKLILLRNLEFQYKISEYTDKQLLSIQRSLDVARKSLFEQIGNMDMRLPEGREHSVLQELNNMTFSIQAQLTKDIQKAAMVAGETSIREYGQILSFDGQVDEVLAFNYAIPSPEQLKAMVNVPVGGKLMGEWVKDSFTSNIVDGIQTSITAGMLQGIGTDKIINGLTQAFGMIKKDAETLARTHIASANNAAAERVYKANADLIKKERWDATFEVSTKSGGGTCMQCGALHGQEFKLDDPHIRPPIHHNCRCYMTPITLSFKELGLDVNEMRASLKPFTERADNRKILKAGQLEDVGFEQFIKSRDEKYQINFFGPTRFKMWKDGDITVRDLIDKNGNIRLLKKDSKTGEYTGLVRSVKHKEPVIVPVKATKKPPIKNVVTPKTIPEAPKPVIKSAPKYNDIAQAQSFAKKNLIVKGGACDYSSLLLAADADSINKALMDEFNVSKFSLSELSNKMITKGATMEFGHTGVKGRGVLHFSDDGMSFMNPVSVMTNRKQIQVNTAKLKDLNKEFIDTRRQHNKLKKQGDVTAAAGLKKKVVQIKAEEKYLMSSNKLLERDIDKVPILRTSGDIATTRSERVQIAVRHEIGHLRWHESLSSADRSKVKSIYNKALKDDLILSQYAKVKTEEYFAESYVLWRMGATEFIDKGILDLLGEITF